MNYYKCTKCSHDMCIICNPGKQCWLCETKTFATVCCEEYFNTLRHKCKVCGPICCNCSTIYACKECLTTMCGGCFKLCHSSLSSNEHTIIKCGTCIVCKFPHYNNGICNACSVYCNTCGEVNIITRTTMCDKCKCQHCLTCPHICIEFNIPLLTIIQLIYPYNNGLRSLSHQIHNLLKGI